MAPAKDAFVRTGEGWGSFHAAMGRDTVERVFVARASTAEGGFGPAADFDAGVGADYAVALFGQGGVSWGVDGDHFFR